MIWTFGAFELDDELFELRQNGSPLALRPRVFDVLRYLVTHRDRVVSKEELLREVWREQMIHDGVMAQNIAILRRILGDSRQSARMIQTLHGRGYRFVAPVGTRGSNTAPASATMESQRPSAPFVGRDSVMRELSALLSEACAGRGGLVFITGDPGIGKTRTAEELTAVARAAGAAVIEGHCHEDEAAPAFWPWQQALRAGSEGADIEHVLRQSRPQPRDGADARFRVFACVVDLLAKRARPRPLVLILEDLHWADEASLLLLRFLSREVRAMPLLVACTARELHDGDPSRQAQLLRELLASAGVRWIRLRGLSEDQTAELAAQTLQFHLVPQRVVDLHGVTEGNPLLVREFLRLVADGREESLRSRGLGPALPDRLREVIDLRLQGLEPELRRLLTVASVIGRDFSVAVLEPVTEFSRSELLRLLAIAVRRRIVRAQREIEGSEPAPSGSSGVYSFAHALIRESLYAGLPEPERVHLHHGVARAIEKLHGADAGVHLEELAYHYFRAASGGPVSAAVTYSMRAAEHALGLLAFEQAALHYRRALEALACSLPIDEMQRFELKLALGSALFRSGQDGNPELLGAARTARTLGRPDLLGRAALAMCGWPFTIRRGRTANCELYPLLVEALSSTQQDAPVLRARLGSALALNSPRETSVEELAERSREVLEMARGLGDDETLYDALLARVRLLQAPEDTTRRLALATELLAVAERVGQQELVFAAHEQRVQPLLALGEIAAADQAIAHCSRLAGTLGLRRCKLQVLRFRLERAFGDGRWDDIARLTEEAVRTRGAAEISPGYVVNLFIWRTFERALRGDRAWFDRSIGKLSEGVEASSLMRGYVAQLYALFGMHDQARACYAPLLESGASETSRDDDWLTTWVLMADAITTCGDLDAARRVYPRLTAYAGLNVAHAEWLIYLGSCAHWLGGLAALLGDRDAASNHFEAALELTRGSAPVRRWRGPRSSTVACCSHTTRRALGVARSRSFTEPRCWPSASVCRASRIERGRSGTRSRAPQENEYDSEGTSVARCPHVYESWWWSVR